jgi:hypothetical protein
VFWIFTFQQQRRMSETIVLKEKNVYGNTLTYVVSNHAQAIQHLTNKKTIDSVDIQALRDLGFRIVHS